MAKAQFDMNIKLDPRGAVRLLKATDKLLAELKNLLIEIRSASDAFQTIAEQDETKQTSNKKRAVKI